MRRLLPLLFGLILALAMAIPAVAHPNVPPEGRCVINPNAAGGIHTAADAAAGTLADHILWVKSPHACD